MEKAPFGAQRCASARRLDAQHVRLSESGSGQLSREAGALPATSFSKQATAIPQEAPAVCSYSLQELQGVCISPCFLNPLL